MKFWTPETALFVSITFVAVAGTFLAGAEARPVRGGAPPSTSLQAQVAAQGKMIKALAAQVAALQRGSAGKSMQARSGRPPSHSLPNLTHKLKLTALPADLKNRTSAMHTQAVIHFQPVHIYPIVLPTSSVQGLQAQLTQLSTAVNALSTQVNQMSSQMNSLQTAQSFDVNLLGEEINWTQTNLTTVANSVPVLPPGQGFCGGNGGMTWGSIKQFYLNGNGLDNAFFCYLLQ